jgi:hypothetical protein
MLMPKFATTCLRHLLSFVALIVKELHSSIYWHKIWLRFERYILEAHYGHLEWIKLLPKEAGHDWQVAFNSDFEPLYFLSL